MRRRKKIIHHSDLASGICVPLLWGLMVSCCEGKSDLPLVHKKREIS